MFRPELTRSSAEPIDYIEVALQTAGESVRAPDDSICTAIGQDVTEIEGRSAQTRVERFALDELHRDVVPAVRFADLVHRQMYG